MPRAADQRTELHGGSESGMLEINQAKQLKGVATGEHPAQAMLADEMLGKELLKEVLEKKL